MLEFIQRRAREIHPEVVAIRRHLHQYPELSFEEERTARFVAERLAEYGIPHRVGVAGHGVVAWVEGQNPAARCIALRADMDALPIREANEVPYRSRHEGVMHACGHDVHTACLLGAARILQEGRKHFAGTVRLLFQPAEERLPGGASLMIREGVLENPRPAAIFGQHVHPPLEVGKIGLKAGMYMASADELYLTVRGRGGHAALPQDTIDPVLIASHLVVAMQQLVSRQADPTIPTVLSFGKIQSEGGATNVIPEAVHLEGTFRTLNEEWRAEAHARMQELAEGLARSMGGSCELRIVKGYPFLINDEQQTARARALAQAYLGPENVVDLPIRMTAEDFSYYSQQIPACFYRLGTGNPARGITSPVHTPTFDVDEACLEWGAGLLAFLAAAEP
ncbi:MAG: amidohydrolase [Bacteroidetes bacterium]|nr:MAG: amidohydrolase [Bacteroidota bacterium]